MASADSLKTRRELVVGDKTYAYYSLRAAEEAGLSGVARLPVSTIAASTWSAAISPSPVVA